MVDFCIALYYIVLSFYSMLNNNGGCKKALRIKALLVLQEIMISVLEENLDSEFKVTVMARTTEMESTWTFLNKITDKVVP